MGTPSIQESFRFSISLSNDLANLSRRWNVSKTQVLKILIERNKNKNISEVISEGKNEEEEK